MESCSSTVKLLNCAYKHSTIIGTAWVSVFAIHLFWQTHVMTELWKENRSNLFCNTQVPGCEDDCYKILPFNEYKLFLWIKMLAQAAPILIYLWYVCFVFLPTKQKKEDSDEEQLMGDRDLGQDGPSVRNNQGKVHISRDVPWFYIFKVTSETLIQVGFLALHVYLSGFQLEYTYVCDVPSCVQSVNCRYALTVVKQYVMLIELIFDCISLFLSMLDVCHLVWKKVKQRMTNRSSSHSPEFRLEPQILRERACSLPSQRYTV